MGTSDLFGDLRERRIRRAGILESIFRYRDSVGASVPFAKCEVTDLCRVTEGVTESRRCWMAGSSSTSLAVSLGR
jgi:hypothetical protein